MKIGSRQHNWDRASEALERAKVDLAIGVGGGFFCGLATLDANFSFFANGRAVATVLAYATGGTAALLGVRAGFRVLQAGAFAAVAGAQYVLGAGASASTASSAEADRPSSAS
jgi:hypothetical protein